MTVFSQSYFRLFSFFTSTKTAGLKMPCVVERKLFGKINTAVFSHRICNWTRLIALFSRSLKKRIFCFKCCFFSIKPD